MAGRRNASRERRELSGTVRDLARLGDAVVTTDRGTVLAPGAFPGEQVELTDLKKQRGVLRGRVARILARSPDRVEPPCPLVDRCGGCPWMGLAPARQREIKRRFVTEAAGVEAAMEPAGMELAYRRRARLAFERGRIGYRAPRSRRVVDVSACAVLSPPLAVALDAIRELWGPHLAGEGEIALAVGAEGRAVIALRSEDAQPAAVYDGARALAGREGIAGVSVRAGGASVDARFGDPRERALSIDGEPIWGAVAGFSQAQDEVNRALVERVVELAEPEGTRLLELYAGHGNLTVPLAQAGASVVAVEQDPSAAEACRANLAARGLAAEVITGDAAEHARRPVDVVVLDPPRTGARDAVVGILESEPARIVYVSCDTATLARDLRTLRDAGYGVDRAHAFDMFPHTAHVEAVVRATRLPSAGVSTKKRRAERP